MRRSAVFMGAVILVGAVCGVANHALAQQRWGAADPDNEGRVHFGWGSSKKTAGTAAMRACRRVSKTCATSPGDIREMNHVWALMCCTNPRFGCAVASGRTRTKAHEGVTEIFVGAHFSNCAIRGYYSVRTGKRL